MSLDTCSLFNLPITPGEVADRLTIQSLRVQHLPKERVTGALLAEIRTLEDIWETVKRTGERLDPLREQLHSVNERLWNVEDQLREHESRGDFGPEFVGRARSVYVLNDMRSEIKRTINNLCAVPHTEVKTFGLGASVP